MRRNPLFSLLTPAVFLACVFFSFPEAHAVQITNKSTQKIGAAVIRVKGDHKTTLFVKILQPDAVLDFVPPAGDGSLLVSVKVFDTDQTLRMPDVSADVRLSFENGQLLAQK